MKPIFILVFLFSLTFESLLAQRTDVSTLSVSLSWKYRDQSLHISTPESQKVINLASETQYIIKLYGKASIKLGSSDTGKSPAAWATIEAAPGKTYNYEALKGVGSSLKQLKKPLKQPYNETIELIISPDYTQVGNVAVKVVDEKGNPLSNAQVKVEGTTQTGTTDSNGECKLKNVDKGNRNIVVSKKDCKTQSNTLNVVGEKTTPLSVTLHNEIGNLLVTVLNENNQPIKGAQVGFLENKVNHSGTTNEKGEWLFENIVEGNKELSITTAGYQSQKSTAALVAQTTTPVKISMLPIPPKPAETAVLSGIVINKATGTGKSKATVVVAGQGTVETDKDGKFAITVKAGLLSAMASKAPLQENSPRYVSITQTINIAPGKTEYVRFELEPAPIVPIEIAVPNVGAGIESASLALTLNNIQASIGNMQYQVKINGERMENIEKILNNMQIPAGVQGDYKLELALLPEQYKLLSSGTAKIEIVDMLYPDIPAFDVALPQMIVNRKIKEGEGATIKGQVRNDKGEVVQGAVVTASNTSKTAVTDAKGEFELSGVPSGNALVAAAKPGENIPSITTSLKAGEVLQSDFMASESNIEDDIRRGNFHLHIQFATASAEIPNTYTSILTKLLNAINALPEYHFTIEGHTDSDGDAEANRKLSQKRAASVLNWLVSHGATKTALSSEGYGEDRPTTSNSTKEGKTLNRRVEVIVRKVR